MKYDSDIHHRKSIRLKGYDYSKEGAYYVTICAKERECLFVDIVASEMKINDAGKMVDNVIKGMPERFDNIEIEEHIIMPNHCHIIIYINKNCRGDPCDRPELGTESGTIKGDHEIIRIAPTEEISGERRMVRWAGSFRRLNQ